jgi:hypothetical protein
VPANMFASASLGYVIEMASELWNNNDLVQKATKLKNEIDDGINVSYSFSFLIINYCLVITLLVLVIVYHFFLILLIFLSCYL